MGPSWAHVALVRDKDISVPQICSPEDVKALVVDLLERDREWFVTIYLDTRKKVLRAEITSIGTLDASLVHPREVFTMACLCKAGAVILVHNHPSGNTAPSKEDVEITKRLVAAGEILGIDVIDHVIVAADGNHYSMKEHGKL